MYWNRVKIKFGQTIKTYQTVNGSLSSEWCTNCCHNLLDRAPLRSKLYEVQWLGVVLLKCRDKICPNINTVALQKVHLKVLDEFLSTESDYLIFFFTESHKNWRQIAYNVYFLAILIVEESFTLSSSNINLFSYLISFLDVIGFLVDQLDLQSSF